MTTTGSHTGYGRPVLALNTGGALPRLRRFVIPGADRTVDLRDGAVGFLLVDFATWWHRRIHPLNAHGEQRDEWGWAPRPVRGTTTVWSEHAAGAAIDLDATLHPRGVPVLRTFKPYQVARIHYRLRTHYRAPNGERVLGWGGDYSRTVDGMHVEWARGTNLTQAERVAKSLFDTPIGSAVLAANPGLRKVIES